MIDGQEANFGLATAGTLAAIRSNDTHFVSLITLALELVHS
jgi:hypothetical protein